MEKKKKDWVCEGPQGANMHGICIEDRKVITQCWFQFFQVEPEAAVRTAQVITWASLSQ